MRYVAKLIKLTVHAVANHVATLNLIGGIRIYFALYAVADYAARIKLLANAAQHLISRGGAKLLDRGNSHKRIFQLHKFARSDASHSHFRYKSLNVANHFKLLLQQLAPLGVAEEVFHHIEAAIDLWHVLQRE